MTGFVSFAQIPPGYYNSAANLSGDSLKVALHQIIKNHNSISYNAIWNAFSSTDKKPNGKVWDIYSDRVDSLPPYEFTFNTDQCGNYSQEGDCYNREHTWPQSWFNSQTTPSSDLFHIQATDGYVNNIRNNYPYGEVGTATYTSQNGGKLGNSIVPGYTGTVFEPIDAYKGDIARNYFYMTTRYYAEDGSWANTAATTKASINTWQLALLLNWHHLDTVSAKEQARNNAIYAIQNNRNPFIDHPIFADSIWYDMVTTQIKNEDKKNSLSIYPNPAQNIVNVTHSNNQQIEKSTINLSTIDGLVLYTAQYANQQIQLDVSAYPKGIYFLQYITASAVIVKTILVQ